MRRRWRWDNAAGWAAVGAAAAVFVLVMASYLVTVGVTWAFLGAWEWAVGAPLLAAGYNVWRLGLVVFAAVILVKSGLRGAARKEG